MCGNEFKKQDFDVTLFHRRARLTSAVLSKQSLSLHQLPLVYILLSVIISLSNNLADV